ncbi:hypothetical protein MP638_006989 [Amoeboaphelidium occidentale]|jgi:putative transcription factor|nr:hypothetical protein MP638_006989 [Amoeboaphelidium occidentale]
MQSNTDWDSVTVIRKKAPSAKEGKSEAAVNAARRTGAAVITEKKATVAGNAKPVTDLNTAKLDRETEELSHKHVSPDVGRAIQQARQKLGMTQKDLGVKINEKPQIVQEYESSKAIPNQQVLGKLERALGVKLRGKDIGQPLGPKKGSK